MLALLALVCFVLVVANVAIGGINLLALGLVFLAAYFVVPWTPWR